MIFHMSRTAWEGYLLISRASGSEDGIPYRAGGLGLLRISGVSGPPDEIVGNCIHLVGMFCHLQERVFFPLVDLKVLCMFFIPDESL